MIERKCLFELFNFENIIIYYHGCVNVCILQFDYINKLFLISSL